MNAPAQRAFNGAVVSLLIFGACLLPLLPPMNEVTTESVPKTVFLAIGLGASVLLHLVFLGIAVKRLGRSVVRWVAFSALLFPVGSIVALVMLGFFEDEAREQHKHA